MLSARPTTISSYMQQVRVRRPHHARTLSQAHTHFRGHRAPRYDADDDEPRVERVLKGGHGEAQVREHARLWRRCDETVDGQPAACTRSGTDPHRTCKQRKRAKEPLSSELGDWR